MSAPSVAAVVMNWNGLPWLQQCLPSLAAQEYPSLQVVVAECNSTDGSADWVRRHFPQFRVMQFDHDCSAPFANNACFQEANADWICILNNDVILPPDCIRKLATAAVSAPEDAVLMPAELGWDGCFVRCGYPDFVVGRALGRWGREDRAKAFYPSTACCLVRRSTLLKFPLNEDLFLYEDTEWGWRIVMGGGEMIPCPEAHFFHHGAATFAARTRRQIRLQGRNTVATLWICASPLLLLGLAPAYFCYYLLGTLRLAVRRRHAFEFLSGLGDFVRGFASFQRHRREAQALRRRSGWTMFRRMLDSQAYDHASHKAWPHPPLRRPVYELAAQR